VLAQKATAFRCGYHLGIYAGVELAALLLINKILMP
jgi:hypothetical protein